MIKTKQKALIVFFFLIEKGGGRGDGKCTWNSLPAVELKRSSLSSCPWFWLAPFRYNVMFPFVFWPGPGPHRGCQIAEPYMKAFEWKTCVCCVSLKINSLEETFLRHRRKGRHILNNGHKSDENDGYLRPSFQNKNHSLGSKCPLPDKLS